MSIYSDDLTALRLSEMPDVDRLWWSQFGNRGEVIVRLASLIVVALLLWLYDGSLLGPIWLVSYLIPLSTCYIAVRPNGMDGPNAWIVGAVSYAALAITFASLPIYLLASSDPVLVFCAALGVMTLGAFTLMREEPPAIVPPLDIAIGWVAIAVAAGAHIPSAESFSAKAVMGILCIVVGVYYTMALLSVRAARVDVRAAAKRSQRTTKAEAVGRLSGGIAHDFNNILTALQGSLELYHEVPAGPERDALVNEATEASVRASTLVSQLLAFARRAPMTPQPLAVARVIEDASLVARRTLSDAIRVDIRMPDQPLHVMADPDGLQSALQCLIQNAKDAMGSRGTLVLACDLNHGSAADGSRSASETPIGAHLSFSVADDGPGMTDDVLDRATEPFFTTKTVGQGSGLGLSMAAGFAEQSGGALRIKTSDDGTIVSLHLPIAPPQT